MQNKRRKNLPNPQDNANFISKILFSFQDRILWKARKTDLSLDDLFNTRNCDQASVVHDQLNRCWERSLVTAKKKKSKGRFMWAIWNMVSRQFLFLLVFPLIEELLKLGQAITLGKVLTYFSGTMLQRDAFLWAFALFMCCLLAGLIHHNFFYQLQAMGMRTRVASCSLVYAKLLDIPSASFMETSTGRAVNMLSSDVTRFDFLFLFAPYFIMAPYQLVIVTIFCWYTIGWYCIVGICWLIALAIMLPLTSRAFRVLRKKTVVLTDQRISSMNELLYAIKVVKAYCWEDLFMKHIEKIRKSEIWRVLQARALEAVPPSISTSSIKIAMCLIITVYFLLNESVPRSEAVYQVLTAISPVRVSLLILFALALRFLSESRVSCDRIQGLLLMDDLLEKDKHWDLTEEADAKLSTSKDSIEDDHKVGSVKAENCFITWSKLGMVPALKSVNLDIRRGSLVAVVGPVGCGKTALLHAILGEMFIKSGTCKCHGVISYSSQEPWIFTGTIRQNVLFGKSYDKDRYNNAIKAVGMDEDINQFEARDYHYLGDCGSGLSGGQKSRLSLARAVYADADVYLLDEPLGAVDVRTAEHIFTKCIKNILIGKTVMLATHQIHFLPQCDWVVVLEEGTIVSQGTFEDLKQQGINVKAITPTVSGPPSSLPTLMLSRSPLKLIRRSIVVEDDVMEPVFIEGSISIERALSVVDAVTDTEQEKMVHGDVSTRVYVSYFSTGAGHWILAVLVALLEIITVVMFVISDWWLAFWLNESASRNVTTVFENVPVDTDSQGKSDNYFLLVFVALNVGSFVASIIRCLAFTGCCVNSTRVLHDRMFYKILRAPLYFFTENPLGVILNRFSKDVGVMDDILPQMLQDAIDCFLIVLGLLLYIAIVNPYTLAVIVPYIAAALYLRHVYLKCGQDVKRLDAITRTPVFSHLSNSLQGLTTIRSFHMEQRLKDEFNDHLDFNSRAFNMFLTTQKWFQIRLEIMSALFVLCSSVIFIALGTHISTADAGLSLSYAVTMLGLFQWAVRQSAEAASYMTSVERVLEYGELSHEQEADNPVEPGQSWPEHGELKFEDASFAYSKDDDQVLRNLNFAISGGQKVGIVGRTGAGKSSVFNAILRMGEVRGRIVLDGINLPDVKLHHLRSKIALIPQEPVFFTGTVRKNLDPFDIYGDDEIWTALQQVEMKQEIERLGLHSVMSEGGSNFSVGQRQLLCLARALLASCKLMLVDEATANVDKSTDILIQSTIRNVFRDYTVLTVAHRLNTIADCDVVLVFDHGNLEEIDSPSRLLRNHESRFYKLAKEAGPEEFNQLMFKAGINENEEIQIERETENR